MLTILLAHIPLLRIDWMFKLTEPSSPMSLTVKLLTTHHLHPLFPLVQSNQIQIRGYLLFSKALLELYPKNKTDMEPKLRNVDI